MHIVKMSVLAAAVVALSAPAFAGGAGGGCGGYKSAKSKQTIATKTGPQTTVKQTASTQK
jgi:hypothetical protein